MEYNGRYLIILSGESDSPSCDQDRDSDKRSEDILILRDVWVFDTEECKWHELQPRNSDLYLGRMSFTATLFRDCILIVGGLKSMHHTHKHILALHLKEPYPSSELF